MINLITTEGKLLASSREVATNFGKEHRNVTKAINEIVTELEGSAQNVAHLFIESEYVHPQNNQTYKEYLMTEEGFSILVMGFTGKKALEWKLKYVEAFSKMKQALETNAVVPGSVDSNFMFQIAEAMKRQEETIAAQNSLIEKQKPQVALAKSIQKAEDLIKVGDMAKIICQAGVKIGQNRFFEWLRENGYMMNTTSSKTNKVPTQRAIELGVLKLVESTFVMDGETRIYKTSMVTPKGQVYFMNKFMNLAENLKPAELEIEEIKLVKKTSKTKQGNVLSLLN